MKNVPVDTEDNQELTYLLTNGRVCINRGQKCKWQLFLQHSEEDRNTLINPKSIDINLKSKQYIENLWDMRMA